MNIIVRRINGSLKRHPTRLATGLVIGKAHIERGVTCIHIGESHIVSRSQHLRSLCVGVPTGFHL